MLIYRALNNKLIKNKIKKQIQHFFETKSVIFANIQPNTNPIANVTITRSTAFCISNGFIAIGTAIEWSDKIQFRNCCTPVGVAATNIDHIACTNARKLPAIKPHFVAQQHFVFFIKAPLLNIYACSRK